MIIIGLLLSRKILSTLSLDFKRVLILKEEYQTANYCSNESKESSMKKNYLDTGDKKIQL